MGTHATHNKAAPVKIQQHRQRRPPGRRRRDKLSAQHGAIARGAILIVDDSRKRGFHSWPLLPKAAILDPELTAGLPPRLTAGTGMDAIAHCIETFWPQPSTPPADGIALDGLARGWAHIEPATHNGRDLDSRLHMLYASL